MKSPRVRVALTSRVMHIKPRFDIYRGQQQSILSIHTNKNRHMPFAFEYIR